MNKSNVFRLFTLLMVLLNLAYVSIEIYKSKISYPLLAKSDITQMEFAKLETLSNYALTFETAFLISSIVSIMLMFTKKYKPLLKRFIVIQISYLIVFFAMNNVLARVFEAPVGNMTQLLFGPFILVFGVLIYLVIKNFYPGLEVKRN